MSRKGTQRERLLAGMLATANSEGYAAASVADVVAHAGVSKPTFYDYFAGKEDGFLAAHRDSARRLLAQVRDAVARAPAARAPQAAIRRLIESAEAEPARARLLANETMAAGPRALDERDRTISGLERIIETARGRTQPRTPSPDLPTRALLGATHWLLSTRLRGGEREFAGLADELSDWIDSYDRPFAEHRWRELRPGPSPPRSPHISELPMQPPPPLPSGRSSLSEEAIARNQRERIFFAIAELAAKKGFLETTIADIATAAQVDRRVFAKHFPDKQQAFLAVHELAFQQTMAIAASSFFSAEAWPERVWQGVQAASQFNATYPIARVIYLESQALGDPAIQRVQESHAAFTIFLQEGNQHTTGHQSQTAMEAIVAATFEIGYQQFRHSKAHQLPSYAYQATYLCLAPFLGPASADELIDAKLHEHRSAALPFPGTA